MDHKIKDQKVFIKLSSVTALQKRFQRSQRAYDLATDKTGNEIAKAAAKARMEAFEEAIAVMELPIS
jgi:hypothetical protein